MPAIFYDKWRTVSYVLSALSSLNKRVREASRRRPRLAPRRFLQESRRYSVVLIGIEDCRSSRNLRSNEASLPASCRNCQSPEVQLCNVPPDALAHVALSVTKVPLNVRFQVLKRIAPSHQPGRYRALHAVYVGVQRTHPPRVDVRKIIWRTCVELRPFFLGGLELRS